MTSIAIKGLQRVRKHRLIKSVEEFLGWWWSELVAGLPPRIKEFLDTHAERLLARTAGEEVLLWRDSGGGQELARFRVGDDEEIARQAVRGALARFDEGQPRGWFLVDEDQVLIQRLSLPAAAEENLRQVLSYEMDRHTPFSAEQVCFDFRVLGQREDVNQIRVELIVVRRELIERLWKICSDRGLDLDGIDVCRDRSDGALAVLGVNLLEPERRARHNHRYLKIGLGLAALLIVLVYVAMWQSLAAREKALESFREKNAQAQQEAKEVTELRDQLASAREAALFLSEKKGSNPVIMTVLDEVTRVLPDQVWIQRLQVNGDKVDLTGQAPEASALLEVLEQAKCLQGAVAKGAFTPDAQSGKERFTIEVSIKCRGSGNGATAAG